MSIVRKRKVAAARLGIEFEKRYEKLVLARTDDEIVIASVDLGQLFNDNAEFLIWTLKKFGGLNPPNPEEIKKVPPPAPANDLPTLPEFLKPAPPAVEAKCTCPVLEHGIIGRDKHMTACPEYRP
jgi:hypothetical protein